MGPPGLAGPPGEAGREVSIGVVLEGEGGGVGLLC